MPSKELELSTSSRSTWVWAVDVDEAGELRRLLEAAGCSVRATAGRNAEPRALDLDIGVVAFDGLAALRSVGYSFRWHPGQHPLDRSETKYGVYVGPAVENPEHGPPAI